MLSESINIGFLDNELVFSFSRSSGPGGQNVNKVNSRVELRFNVVNSQLLSEETKAIILQKLENKINLDGELLIVSQSERSQLGNKEKVVEKFYKELNKVLKPKKPRKASKPTKASIEKRLQIKREISEKKTRRKIE